MRTFVLSVLVAGAIAGFAGTAAAQTATAHFSTPLENDPARTVRMQSVNIPAGGGNGFHRHNGDQWFVVEEGEITFTIKGQAPRAMKVGESVYIPRGTVHRNQNFSDKPARSMELLIIDKDKPVSEQVPD